MKLTYALIVGTVALAVSTPGLAQDLPYGAEGYYPGDPSDLVPTFEKIKPTGEFPVQTERYQKYMSLLKAGKITPFGATRAGGEEGIIPAWNCTREGVPASLKDEIDLSEIDTQAYPALEEFPFQDEEPRFVITADNYQQYADHLTAGVTKLLKSYPDAARIPVYPTHRTACYDLYVYEQTRLNAKYGQVIHDGAGAIGIKGGMPFPLPANGYAANWNNLVGMQGVWNVKGYRGSAAIFPGGRMVVEQQTRPVTMYYYMDPTISRIEYWAADARYMQAFLAINKYPARSKGRGVIGWNRLHKARHPRVVWQYSPGTRRVRRYPYFGFDTPDGAGGLHGIDENAIWSGTPNRFNVKILGVKKLIVPYNAYGIDIPDSYEGVIGYPVINPEVTRWELHRMRVIELTLKDDFNHWYERRVLYQDMDTGHYLLADNYDHQGVLWRTDMTNYVWTPIVPGMIRRATIYYDFAANAYNTGELINEQPPGKPLTYNTQHVPIDWFSPAKLRQFGIR